jgi:hypothetical protein
MRFTEVTLTAVTVPPTNRSPASLILPDTSILPVVIEFRDANPDAPIVAVDIATAYTLADDTFVEYISVE